MKKNKTKLYLHSLTVAILDFYKEHKEKSGSILYKLILPYKDKLGIKFIDGLEEVSPFYIYSSFWTENKTEIEIWNTIFNIKTTTQIKSPQLLKDRNISQLAKTITNSSKEWYYVSECYNNPSNAVDIMDSISEGNPFMSIQETSLIGFSVNPELFFGLDKYVETLLKKENLIERYSDSSYFVRLSVKENKNHGNTFYKLLNGEKVDVADFKLNTKTIKPLHLEHI